MAKRCPYCGGDVEEDATRCVLCGDLPKKSKDPLNDTAPFMPTYDAMDELRRTRKFNPVVDTVKPVVEEPTNPLPEHIQQALDDNAEVAEKATVVARPIPGRQIGDSAGRAPGGRDPVSEPAPLGAHDTLSEADAPGVRDTLPDPRQPEVEPADSLRATTMDGAHMRATLVDAPPDEHEAPPASVNAALQDTLINVQSVQDLPDSAEQQRLDSITFSELNVADTGAAPLDSSQFRRPEYDPTAPAPIRLPELETLAQADEGEGANSEGIEVPLGSGERLAPTDPAITAEQQTLARSGGLPWLCRILCLLTGLLWLGVAALFAAPYLALPQLGQVLAWLPIYPVYIPTIPGGLTLICIVLAATVRTRIDSVTREVSWIGTFFKIFFIFLLAALPGIGLLLGLIFGLIGLIKRRPAGGLLLLYTLGWHGGLTLYFWAQALAYARQYLPFQL